MGIERFLKDCRSIFLDSMIFIYFFEGREERQRDLTYLFDSIEQGKMNASTSSLTISEVLVKPYKTQALSLIDEYLRFFNEFPHLRVLPLSQEIAIETARIRAQSNLKTPDAIQLASALIDRSDGFITSDKQLVLSGLNFFYL